jgi:chromosome segregation ATPase
LESDVQLSRNNVEQRVEDLNNQLQNERMERAVVEGTLEAARKDNARLQNEVASLRSTLRRGLPLEEAHLAPNEPDNDETHTTKSRKSKGGG